MANQDEIRLEFKDAKSAKQYTVWLEKIGKDFNVWTAWGRIADKTTATKKRNAKPIDESKAQKEYVKVTHEKLHKGYQLVKGKLPAFAAEEGKATASKPEAITTKKYKFSCNVTYDFADKSINVLTSVIREYDANLDPVEELLQEWGDALESDFADLPRGRSWNDVKCTNLDVLKVKEIIEKKKKKKK